MSYDTMLSDDELEAEGRAKVNELATIYNNIGLEDQARLLARTDFNGNTTIDELREHFEFLYIVGEIDIIIGEFKDVFTKMNDF